MHCIELLEKERREKESNAVSFKKVLNKLTGKENQLTRSCQGSLGQTRNSPNEEIVI